MAASPSIFTATGRSRQFKFRPATLIRHPRVHNYTGNYSFPARVRYGTVHVSVVRYRLRRCAGEDASLALSCPLAVAAPSWNLDHS